MRSYRPRGVIVFALASLLVGATGSIATGHGSLGQTSAAGSGTLVLNMGRGVSTLDPAVAPQLWEVGLIGSFYGRLTQYASKPGPGGTTEYDPAHIKLWLAQSLKIKQN